MNRIFVSFAIFFFTLTFVLSFSSFVQRAQAAGSTMTVSPSSGTFDKQFTVDLVIDGHGDKFNAAQATVALSQSLAIKDLSLGNCNFSFLHTPTVQNPSFAGVVISTYSTKCTAYTLTLVPVAKGNGTITLSKASVKRYGDASEILSSTGNGSYSLTNALKAPEVLGTQMKNTSKEGLYTLYLKVYSSGTTPVANANVILSTVSSKNQQQETTDASGFAHFSNLQEGVYDAVVKEGTNKVGETIVNVSGPNHVLSFSINLSNQKSNPLTKSGSLVASVTSNPLILAGVLAVGIIAGVAIALVATKLFGRKKGN